MQISAALQIIAKSVSENAHIPVIAVEVDKSDLPILYKFGFDISENEKWVFHASLTKSEIEAVAKSVDKGKIRHSRPIPRDPPPRPAT